jgi:hypothetical protein
MGDKTSQPTSGPTARAARREPNKLATTNVTNALADAIEGGALTPHGSNVDPRHLGQPWHLLVMIDNRGPEGEADYQNNTYFGRVQAVSREGAALLQTTDDSDSDEPVITLTNVAESPPRTFEDEGSASVGSTSGVKKVDGPHLLRRGLLVPVGCGR